MINPSQTIYAPEELFLLQSIITDKTQIAIDEPVLPAVMDNSVEIPISLIPENGIWTKYKGYIIGGALFSVFITWVIYEVNQEKKKKNQSN